MDHILEQAARYGTQVALLDRAKKPIEASGVFQAYHAFGSQFEDDSQTFLEVMKAYQDANTEAYWS